MVAFILLRLFTVLLLVAANAFFVAAEFALLSVRDTSTEQLVREGRIGARTVQKIQQRFDELLAAVQFGVTSASLGLGWLGEATLASILEKALSHVPHAVVYAHAISLPVAFLAITFMHVVLGEMVPKSVALQRADLVALAVAPPMDVFMTVARPFLYFTAQATRFVLRLLGSEQVRHAGVHSPEELKLIVTASQRFGLVPELQEEMILRSLELGNLTVREIMTPRTRIFSLPADLPLETAVGRVVEEQHSRIPVYDSQRGQEHIIGLLYSKDLSRWMRLRLAASATALPAPGFERMQVRDIMREVLLVPETKALPELLEEFKQRKRHLAIVVDEFGTTSGLVTVEDVLEQVVGEIEDEFDIAAPLLEPAGNVMVLEGAIPIRDLETQYDLPLTREEGFQTLAGFLLAKLQKIPAAGDAVEQEGHRFTVLELDGFRIAKVRVERLSKQPQRAAGN